jgi:hypothetical protein
MTTTMLGLELASGCPRPPAPVRVAGRNLMLARTGSKEQKAALRPFDRMPRPWAPHTCPAKLLEVLLPWLDQVAAWLNHDYSWRMARPIPACWPNHPHLVHELAVLAWLRVIADQALDIGPIEDWHRYALPAFLNRMGDRMGDSCSTGHEDWPGASRHAGYWADPVVRSRRQVFDELAQQRLRIEPEQQNLELGEDDPTFDDTIPD